MAAQPSRLVRRMTDVQQQPASWTLSHSQPYYFRISNANPDIVGFYTHLVESLSRPTYTVEICRLCFFPRIIVSSRDSVKTKWIVKNSKTRVNLDSTVSLFSSPCYPASYQLPCQNYYRATPTRHPTLITPPPSAHKSLRRRLTPATSPTAAPSLPRGIPSHPALPSLSCSPRPPYHPGPSASGSGRLRDGGGDRGYKRATWELKSSCIMRQKSHLHWELKNNCIMRRNLNARSRYILGRRE